MSLYRRAVEVALWLAGLMVAGWIAYHLGYWAETFRAERLQ